MRFILFLFCILLSPIQYALTLKADAPSRYVVQNGDTLWSIAHHYLKNPWEWRELWHNNPDIKNPNRLYAGATLVLSYHKNRPYLKVSSNGTIKLSPHMRPLESAEAVPPIPLNDLMPFLNESLILDDDILTQAPYVVAFAGGEHLVGGQGDEVYVKGLHPSREIPEGGSIAYSVFRSGKNYIDPHTKELLGYRATLVGYGELVSGGDPARVILTSIHQGIKKDDRVLINNTPEFDLYFEPSAPGVEVKGYVLDMPTSMPRGSTQEAVGGVVTLNIGANQGLKAGDVLGIYNKGQKIPDPRHRLKEIKIPPERIGEVMVFRAFSKTSFALIIRSTNAVHLLDSVTNP